MGDTPWKKHERDVARYFGVERNKRGNDFSVSDCDVISGMDEWIRAAQDAKSGIPYKYMAGGVVVECKQGYSPKPVQLMKEIHGRNRDPKNVITVAFWGPYGFSWMVDRYGRRVFDTVWNDLIIQQAHLQRFLEQYHVEWINRKTPEYLNANWKQARDYAAIATGTGDKGEFYPLVALHAKGMQGRVIVWKMFDEKGA